MGVFDVGNKIILDGDMPNAKKSSDLVGVKTTKEQLAYIAEAARRCGNYINSNTRTYSQSYFKKVDSNWLIIFTRYKTYKTPLSFELFKFPPPTEVGKGDTRILKAIKLILEGVEKAMLEIYKDDDTVVQVLSWISDVSNKTLDEVILKRIVVKLASMTWKPKDQSLKNLEDIVDNLDKSQWPKPLDVNEKESVTRLRLIVLTLLMHTGKLMTELSIIAKDLSDDY